MTRRKFFFWVHGRLKALYVIKYTFETDTWLCPDIVVPQSAAKREGRRHEQTFPRLFAIKKSSVFFACGTRLCKKTLW